MPWPFLLKQAQISARRILPSRRWVRSRMTTRAPGVADWATAAMRRTGLDTQYARRGACLACGLAVAAGGLAPCKSFVATSYASSSRRPIGTTMPSRWPWMPWLPACLPRPRVYDLNHNRSTQRLETTQRHQLRTQQVRNVNLWVSLPWVLCCRGCLRNWLTESHAS